jgi:arylformamidase
MLVCGHSAGGHLTACLLATRWDEIDPSLPNDLVPAGLAISGLFDLEPLVATSVNRALRLTPDEARRLSPLHWPVPRGRILDAAVGTAESGEYLRQSRIITETWAAAGAVTRFVPLARANHFTAIAPLADPASPLSQRLAELAGIAGETA